MHTRSDQGSMLVEVVFLMVLLMLPLFYLVGTLGRLQAGAYAASAAAREAGRAYVTAEEAAAGPGRSAAATELVFVSHGFVEGQGSYVLSCRQSPCLAPGGQIDVAAVVQVDLPLIPDFLAGVVPTSVAMTAQHTEPVDFFREQ